MSNPLDSGSAFKLFGGLGMVPAVFLEAFSEDAPGSITPTMLTPKAEICSMLAGRRDGVSQRVELGTLNHREVA